MRLAMKSTTKERIKLLIKGQLENGLSRNEQMEVARIALELLERAPVVYSAGYVLTSDHEYAQRLGRFIGSPVTPMRLISKKEVHDLTYYWMPEVGEYCEVSTESICDIDWVKIKVIAVHDDTVAAVVCEPDCLDSGCLRIFGWGYDSAIFRPLSEKKVNDAEPVSHAYKLPFLEWLSEQKEKIDVDCGCISTESLMHWMRLAYEAGNFPVTPDGWIPVNERMPEDNQRVLISVNFCGDQTEPLICSARYIGPSKGEHLFSSAGGIIKTGNGAEQATHWMPLPEPPQEVRQ